jgi:hypothetical protein
MTMNRETMLSDLAQYGIKDLEALDDAGVKKMHDKWYPKMIPATPAEEKALRITPEQVEDALDAVTLPQIADGKEA